jgi:tetratricopeptide (TPR) repeat protein
MGELEKRQDELLESAKALRDSGNMDEACKILSQMIEEYPENPAPYAVKGEIYWDLGLLDEAISCLYKAVEFAPENEAFSLGLFYCLFDKSDKSSRHASIDEARRFMRAVGKVTDRYKEVLESVSQALDADEKEEE